MLLFVQEPMKITAFLLYPVPHLIHGHFLQVGQVLLQQQVFLQQPAEQQETFQLLQIIPAEAVQLRR